MARDRAEADARRWADLRLRLVSALILAPVAIAVVWLGGAVWIVLIALLAIGVACEWAQLCGSHPASLPGLVVLASMLAIAVAAARPTAWPALLVLVAGSGLTWAIAMLWPGGPSTRPVSLAAGVIYIGLPAIALIWLRLDDEAGLANVLFVLLIVWSSDVGAYTAGRLFGGPRLAPRISPSKTWSGAAGGLLAAVVVGYGAAMSFAPTTAVVGPAWRIALTAALLSVMSQLGDLLESFLKRRFGVKDSGRLIPGHGGLLDRLDGFLAAAPTAALLAVALGPGVVLWQ
ncbi:MAG: phosphatidate cytidylyltransferase [Alphaproteobacteria bacterium]|nr:phosphatidate cytidylyltransferase [Alphaproteobacteria bacterium]